MLFAISGIYIPDSKPSLWHFTLKDRGLPNSMLQGGVHTIRLGFSGAPLSNTLKVLFLQNLQMVKRYELSNQTEQIGRDGKAYDNNEAMVLALVKKPTPRPLRAHPLANLSEEMVIKMLKERDSNNEFGDKSGKGINHQYKVVTSQSVKLVKDRLTNLTWQRGGSKTFLNFESTVSYIQEINAEKYGGYNDWRLPTLEEAMSLIEVEKKTGNLYINPVFDQEQFMIWTADKESPYMVWLVQFYYGNCFNSHVGFISYVRAVR
ncbi:MAG: DUF1566 domain-containing protein [bacterium]